MYIFLHEKYRFVSIMIAVSYNTENRFFIVFYSFKNKYYLQITKNSYFAGNTVMYYYTCLLNILHKSHNIYFDKI